MYKFCYRENNNKIYLFFIFANFLLNYSVKINYYIYFLLSLLSFEFIRSFPSRTTSHDNVKMTLK